MKKLIIAIILIVAIIAGISLFFKKDTSAQSVASAPSELNVATKAVDKVVGNAAGKVAEKFINDMLANAEFFTVKEKNFTKGDSNSSGYFVGEIKKEDLQSGLAGLIETTASDETKAKFGDFNTSAEEIFPQNLEFRYDYAIAHSVANIADGAQIDGKIKILTPHYMEILEPFFHSDTVASNHVTIATEIKFQNKLSDIDFAQNGIFMTIKGFEISGVCDLEGELVKSANAKVDKILVQGVKNVDFEIENSNYDLKYKKGVKTNSDFVDYFLADLDYKSTVKNLVITVERERLLVAGDLSGEGNYIVENGKFVANDSGKISTLKIADVLLRNVELKSEASMSEKLYREFALSNGEKLKQIGENSEILNEIFEKDLSLNIKNLSLENSVGKKFTASANALIGEPIAQTNDFGKMSLSGFAKLDTSISQFIGVYESLAPLAPLIELYGAQFTKPDGDGVRTDFAYDKASNSFILNDKTIPLPAKEK